MRKSMKMFTSLMISALMIGSSFMGVGLKADASGDIEINETNFPDENFRNCVSENFDIDMDDSLSQDEIEIITEVYFTDYGIKSVKGIEYFTNLEILHLNNNYIEDLDLSKNKNLFEIIVYNNNLKTIKFGDKSKIIILDLSGNPDLILSLKGFSSLKNLYLEDDKNVNINEIYEIPGLERIGLMNCGLTEFDASKFVDLLELDLDNNSISQIDITKNKKLQLFYISENKLTTIDISQNTDLEYISCNKNKLSEIDVSNNTKLWGLSCSDNQIKNLDLSNNTELGWIYCSDNQLTSLDLSKNNELTELTCNNNMLTSLKFVSDDGFVKFVINDNYLDPVPTYNKYKLKEGETEDEFEFEYVTTPQKDPKELEKEASDTKDTQDKSDTKVDQPKYSNEWVDGKWYNIDGKVDYEGILEWKSNETGWWVEDSAGWYPQSKWQKIDGKWYYFNESGYMASEEWRDGYWLSSSGACEYEGTGSWAANSTGWWFEDTSGWYAVSTWQKINGYWYYFGSDGYMVTSQYVDGYWLGSDGVCQ